jgi:hypothetical protein
MRLSRLVYRTRQFWDALKRKPLTATQLGLAQAVLTDKQMALFTRLQPSEQSHALRVFDTLKAKGETHPDILTAALLHDVGKSCHPLRMYERVTIVLGKSLFPKRVQSWGLGKPLGWRRPFVVASGHPLWGAELAQDVDSSPLAVYLIREHQNKIPAGDENTTKNRLLAALQSADQQN